MPVEDVRHRRFQSLCPANFSIGREIGNCPFDKRQARTDAIAAVFVFLYLLEGQAIPIAFSRPAAG
jgi:hypothetical protein